MFTIVATAFISGLTSGIISAMLVINKTIPKNTEPKLDEDMEKLLELNGYIRIKEED